MQLISTALFVALAFVAPSFQESTPAVYIHNGCDFKVNLWSVAAGDPGNKTAIAANGGTWTEAFRVPRVGGVSIKLTPEENCDNPTPVTQLEYTSMSDFLWYDLSDINCVAQGCPFKKHGMYMHSGKGCPTVSCTKGLICAGAYNAWDDNEASLSCAAPSNLYLYLCRDQAPTNTTITNTTTTATTITTRSSSGERAPLLKRLSLHLRRLHRHS